MGWKALWFFVERNGYGFQIKDGRDGKGLEKV